MKGLLTAWLGDVYGAVVRKIMDYSIVLVVIFIVYQCSEAGDVTHGRHEILGEGIWSVNGFVIGDAFEETPFAHEMKWKFTEKPEMPGSFHFTTDVKYFGPMTGLVEFNEDGRVIKVDGTTLLRDNEVVVMFASSARKIKKRLGKGYIVEQYKSTGHDMGAWMRKHLYTEHHYNDAKKTKLTLFTGKNDKLYRVTATLLENL